MEHITPPVLQATSDTDDPDASNRVAERLGVVPGSPWKTSLGRAIRDPDTLLDALELPETLRPSAHRAARLFPLIVPREFAARMRPGDPDDPLLRQVLPLDAETRPTTGFVADPLAESTAARAPGLLQKYRGRALLVTAGTCAINCRYCFRRHFPYDETPRGHAAWEPALETLANDATINEVILSGGDPLVLTDSSLIRLVTRLESIPHISRLRIHSRLPIVLPSRVDDELVGWLRATRLTPVMVVHSNHAQEIDNDCAAALGRLVDAGVPVLNQAVLLRGVNDSSDALADLCERLVDLRVMPYYLHQLDRVDGAAHFHVEKERGLAIVAELLRRLPGYAVPRYVSEVSGEAHKVEIRG